MPRPAVFLDRDDTLVHCSDRSPSGYLWDPTLLEPMPGAVEACASLATAGFLLVVVTNQGGVAKGLYTMADVERFHASMRRRFRGVLDAFYVCPFHPDGTVEGLSSDHEWRKPRPGMLLSAAEELGIDLLSSWMIGDSDRDIQAGRAAGCSAIRVSERLTIGQAAAFIIDTRRGQSGRRPQSPPAQPAAAPIRTP